MQGNSLARVARVVSHVVLGLMAISILYACYIGVTYWPGIGV